MNIADLSGDTDTDTGLSFDDAFKSFTSAGETNTPEDDEPKAGQDEEVEEGGDDEGAEEGGDDEGGDEGADEGGDEGSNEGADEGTEQPQQPDSADELIDRLAGMLKQRGEDEKPAAQQQTEEKPAATDTAPAAYQYSDDEKKVIQDYFEEYPDVARAEQLVRRAEYHDMLKFVFSEVSKHLAPLTETVETLAVRTQLNDIVAANEDYPVIREKVVAWVDDQPAYLQAAYKQVMETGTAEEVNDLISRYRAATGEGKPAVERKKAEPSETAKKAAKSMAPVSTRRSVIAQDEPDDFDSAFERFANQK